MSSVHRGRSLLLLSNLSLRALGFDCKAPHFLNAMLEFDPATGQFAFATLEVPNAYYQATYLLSAGGEFYVTCNNILEDDGQLNVGRVGELLYLAIHRIGNELKRANAMRNARVHMPGFDDRQGCILGRQLTSISIGRQNRRLLIWSLLSFEWWLSASHAAA